MAYHLVDAAPFGSCADVLICSVGTEVFYNKASPAGVLAGQSHHQTIRLGRCPHADRLQALHPLHVPVAEQLNEGQTIKDPAANVAPSSEPGLAVEKALTCQPSTELLRRMA
jgi:hypothetical protein